MAAVASSRAATIYHCRILLRDIADSKANFTRFLVLQKEPLRHVRGHGKSSVIFSTENRPRALYDALGVFADRNINLTKIESRPTKRKPWEYYFFVDFDGIESDKSVREAIAALSTRAGFVKFLGSYPRSL